VFHHGLLVDSDAARKQAGLFTREHIGGVERGGAELRAGVRNYLNTAKKN
jgi:hypothetical protein